MDEEEIETAGCSYSKRTQNCQLADFSTECKIDSIDARARRKQWSQENCSKATPRRKNW